jgi:hypothetical protein
MANTRAQNATLITTNIPDNNEKLVTPSKVREVENALNDSGVNINGDTFAEDAVFEFNNGSKLREGVIQHGFGGGIARVCANDKTDQWEDGFRYLISTTGSFNTVIYAETINNIVPDDTYDETDSWAVGSRIKNLVTGIEYLCTQANEGDAIWAPLSGSYEPVAADLVEFSDLIIQDATFSTTGNIVNLHGRLRPSTDGAPTDTMSANFPLPTGLRAKLSSQAVITTVPLNVFSAADITAASISTSAENANCFISFSIGASPAALGSDSIIFHLQYETDFL